MSEARAPEPVAVQPYAITFAGAAPPLAIPDARSLVTSAFEDAANLWLFEAGLRHPRNLSSPNHLTYDNWALVQVLRGQGAEWGETPAFEDAGLEERIAEIPPGADLFRDWGAVAAPTLRALQQMMDGYGLNLQAATAMLYQKRPLLVPVLDRFTRQACGNAGPQQWSAEALRAAIEGFREVGKSAENWASLARLTAWFSERPAATSHLALSRVRILNLIASRAAQAVAVTSPEPSPRRRRGRRGTPDS